MADAAPAIAIVIVNYNSAAFVDEFCATLEAVVDLAWRLIAIDSASTDASMDAIERAFPSAVTVRCDENVGFAAGANIGIERALALGAEYVLFLNIDVALTPDFLRGLGAPGARATLA